MSKARDNYSKTLQKLKMTAVGLQDRSSRNMQHEHLSLDEPQTGGNKELLLEPLTLLPVRILTWE